MSRVGVFSGTFDPVHEGHVAFALQGAAECGLQKVYFLTEPVPRRKQAVRDIAHRQAMVKLAVEDHDQLGTIVLEDRQFNVLETMPHIQRRFSDHELYFLCGDDFLYHLIDWPHLKEMTQNVTFIIAKTGRFGQAEAIIQRVKEIESARMLSFRYTLVDSPKSEISSTAIRSAVSEAEFGSLDPVVADYIQKNNLYL